VSQSDSLTFTVDSPTAFTDVTDKLARAGVRIQSAYFSTAGDASLAVLSVLNVAAAQDALQSQ
jgi:hypothetical protein